MNIYVSNLSFNAQDEDLKELFTPFGDVSSAKVIMDRETGKSRGFGFVEMPNDEDANKAMGELNESVVDGMTLRVAEARPREERSSGGRSNFNSNRSGGGGGGYSKSRW